MCRGEPIWSEMEMEAYEILNRAVLKYARLTKRHGGLVRQFRRETSRRYRKNNAIA
jgi:hypothetical protein